MTTQAPPDIPGLVYDHEDELYYLDSCAGATVMLISDTDYDAWRITALQVRPELRQHGHGTQLLKTILSWADHRSPMQNLVTRRQVAAILARYGYRQLGWLEQYCRPAQNVGRLARTQSVAATEIRNKCGTPGTFSQQHLESAGSIVIAGRPGRRGRHDGISSVSLIWPVRYHSLRTQDLSLTSH